MARSSHTSSMLGARPPPAAPSTRPQAAGRERAGRGSAATGPDEDATLSSCSRATAPRQLPLQAAAMASKDSGSGPSFSRWASSARARATCAGLGETSSLRQSFRSESRDSTVCPPQVRMTGCGEARTAGASLSLRAGGGSSGTSSTTRVSLPSVTSRAVRCLFRRLSKNLCPSGSSRLYSKTFLSARQPRSRAPHDLPQPGRPATSAAADEPGRPQRWSQARSCAQGRSGLRSLRSLGP
mmetsp:Transcript_54400/g.158814  ORF Transcript_54400/g.158814 Transcript_54400/m.158814 type:complete len:240 (+) Transcript_54400:455-1174(+)